MIYASTFLSHSSDDKSLVNPVARELVRHGINTWLDKNDLPVGISLIEALDKAIQKQTTVTLFLSPKAVESSWVDDELVSAFKKAEEIGVEDEIIPVYLDEPFKLVSKHDLLRDKWLHPDGDRVKKTGIVIQNGGDVFTQAKEIAEKAANQIYKILKLPQQQEIIIYVDQRGEHNRHGEIKNLPANISTLNVPILVFRPALGERSEDETLFGQEWNEIRLTMEKAISEALSGVRWVPRKKIRILGNAQLGFAFLLGQIFHRNTSADLFCTNYDGRIFNNKNQERPSLLGKGNPQCEALHKKIKPIKKNEILGEISLLLMPDRLIEQTLRYFDTKPDAPRRIWIKNGFFTENQQVQDYIADIVSFLKRLSSENGVHTVYLYCGLPFHVIPLLAADLLYTVEKIVFMEFRKDLMHDLNSNIKNIYVPLQTKMG